MAHEIYINVGCDKLESAFYKYYFVKTDCLSNTWNTIEIQDYLINQSFFLNQKPGSYRHKYIFLTLQLLLVKDYDSWSDKDYDNKETNYISIVTTSKLLLEVTDFFHDFEIFLGWRIIEEND